MFRNSSNLGWLFIAGMSIGWLSGLSVSPVLATVLSSLLAALGGAIAGLQTFQKTDERASARAQVAPVAMLLFGIALFAPAGVMVRTHCLLEQGGKCPANEVDSTLNSVRSAAGIGGLFNVRQRLDWCSQVLRAPDATIANTMTTASEGNQFFTRITKSIQSPKELRHFAEAICDGS